MSKHDGHNYEPIDLNKGIALECERDEFGHTTHTLWVDGEVYQITENAWEKLMKFNFDRFEEGKQARLEETIEVLPKIIALGNVAEWITLEDEMVWMLPEAIALIKGEAE